MSKKPVLMTKEERREAALKTAVQLAKKIGAKRVSLAMVAAKHGVTAPLLFHIFESREGFTKAIIKAAKKEGVTLPEAAPTVRELRATGKKLKPLPKLKTVKKLAPPKPLPKVKLAALKKPISVVKAIKNKEAAKAAGQKIIDTIDKSRAKLLKTAKVSTPAPAARKPLTPEQRAKKQERDRARRAAAPAPSTPASKFAALPKPFEAAIQQVAA
jgi:AcrR family transcriptional regulator